ncbi:PrsW family intramembrane metalloprotease [Glaciihabitans arcticus]|uniref:PrsW family intramembrane metalloprotease n=1 Tax=Glaciihabitans arcticus TaxID=2668039 RepID=A0A4Q9GNV2_9MICO|nr:PrsW family intramembrane metalloprotease [Glaciihabitans arcticus]TBN56411.1 PrsW family intramembrane metalloprotease [Glaciihabitans arcticus]
MTSSDTTPASAAYGPTASPAEAPVAVRQEAALGTGPHVSAPVARSTTLTTLGIVGIAVLGVVALGVTAYLLLGLGLVAVGFAGIMALIPLAIVLLGVNWIDRWEPEPRGILAFGFLWGAAASVAIALIVGLGVQLVIDSLGGAGAGFDFFGAAIQAPIVEESAKGFGLLLIFWFARKHFDSPVDGIVYAAWIAGGFAFTENILYFGVELVNSGGFSGSVFGILLMRGIMSPFAHVMFTAATGVMLGIAASRGSKGSTVLWFLGGLAIAIGLHALWNGALFFVGENFFGYYALVQFPLFVGAVLLVIFLRKKEAKLTHDRLSEYAAVGWYKPDEVNALATGAGRRQAMAWARQRGLGAVMRRYTRDSTRLAFTRQRLITGRARAGAEADEAALLLAIVATRAQLQSPSAAPVQPGI